MGPVGYRTRYTSALKLIADANTDTLLATVGLHFDDVWSEWGHNRFAGELLAIDEINTEYETRKIDSDRYSDHWHNGNKPWHAAMYQLQVFDHPDRYKTLRSGTQVIK